MVEEIEKEFCEHVIPFWKGLRDQEYGGYYGLLTMDLELHKKAVKGCILNSRILWFFANVYETFQDPTALSYAAHAAEFLKKYCVDREYGGVYWSVGYDGTPEDTTKHTYNQAFAIYALSAYYGVSKDEESLALAYDLFHRIESTCRDDQGYLEAFDRRWNPSGNDKLSENGVEAKRTMNTLLHVMEAYTELYRVDQSPKVKKILEEILSLIATKIYEPKKKRLGVFFDENYHSLIDLHSYGHDIEAAWLLDRTTDLLKEEIWEQRMTPIARTLEETIYQVAFDGHSVVAECCEGEVNPLRIWWVQVESMVGFTNAYEKTKNPKYRQCVEAIWDYIKTYLIDPRPGSEWFSEVDAQGHPSTGKPIVEPWKCPYHTGRMCFELMKRNAF
ncbi:MAG: AGE family epimerase/isomerase [Lachnospiraceae bacterium]|nr:AGE family epimerase/isomerase [Lachnospiraceae bacterium]